MPLTWNAERTACLDGSQSLVFEKACEYLVNHRRQDRCWRQFAADIILRASENAPSGVLDKRKPLIYREAQTLPCEDELDVLELPIESSLICPYTRFQITLAFSHTAIMTQCPRMHCDCQFNGKNDFMEAQ